MYENRIAAALVSSCMAVFLVASPLAAQQTDPASSTSSTSPAGSAADNTRMNQRDRSSQTTTPTDQPNDKADIKLAAAVRRAIVKDKSLSMSAHNVKLVAAQGVVTLRGPVKNDDEKANVEAVVKGVAGVSSVNNQLDVKH